MHHWVGCISNFIPFTSLCYCSSNSQIEKKNKKLKVVSFQQWQPMKGGEVIVCYQQADEVNISCLKW